VQIQTLQLQHALSWLSYALCGWYSVKVTGQKNNNQALQRLAPAISMLRDQKSYSIQCTDYLISEHLASLDRGELFFLDLQQELYTVLQILVSKYDKTTETI